MIGKCTKALHGDFSQIKDIGRVKIANISKQLRKKSRSF